MALYTSEQYSFNDITVVMGGRILEGCKGIKFEFGYEQEVIRGKGAKGQAINEKDFDVSGTLKLLQSEVEAIFDTWGKRYQKEYLDITWHFGEDAVIHRTHQIKMAKLGKLNLELNSGDSHMVIDVPFMALDVELNV